MSAPRRRRSWWRWRYRRLGRAMAELHVQLRTEGDTPVRKALSVALGTAVGCLPLPGLHLPLCAGLAHAFKLSRARAYLAAHISNPLTFPLLLYLELAVGRWLFTRNWPALSLAELRGGGSWGLLGRDLAAGTALVATVLAAAFGGVALVVGRRWRKPPFRALLDEVTSRRFVASGVFHWELVRGKLRYDPLYHTLLEAGALPDGGRLLDLGCGRGVLLALLATARDLYRSGHWPVGMPPPPGRVVAVGVELSLEKAVVAARALGTEARVVAADLTRFELPRCRAVVALDVLHYLSAGEQTDMLDRAVSRLEAGGVLLVREADAGSGWRFAVTRAGERLAAFGRGHPRQRFHYRSADDWRRLLAARGLAVTIAPMSAGTPFGNVLITARKPGPAGAGGHQPPARTDPQQGGNP